MMMAAPTPRPFLHHAASVGSPSIARLASTSSSDYAPHLLQSYRAGYRYGKADRLSGFPRDYHRAYLMSGEAWESYFQEGYGHGYDLTGEQH
jgi:hypothetical protein